MKKDFTF